MPTITEQLQQLQTDKETLVTKLTEKGVTASNDETFTTLCPKVGDIQSGEVESEYFESTIGNKQSTTLSLPLMNIIKKIPKLIFNGTNMGNMFCYTKLEEIDFSSFDTSKVTSMKETFAGCNYLKSINLSNFNTSKVIYMQNMFHNCSNLTSIDLSSFNTSSVTNMSNMFYGCSSLTSINLSSFNTSSVTNTSGMFQYCKVLTTIIINNDELFKITSINAFSGTPIASGTGYIYVPDNMVETYKSATNWSTYANQIRPISDLPKEE